MTNKTTLDSFLKDVQKSVAMMTEEIPNLPERWKLSRLGELAKYVNGRVFKQEEWETTGLPIIRIQNLTNPTAPFNYYFRKVKPRYRVKNGDLLISWSATLDAFLWNGGDAILNQHIFKTVVNEELVKKKFLYHGIRHILETRARAQPYS